MSTQMPFLSNKIMVSDVSSSSFFGILRVFQDVFHSSLVFYALRAFSPCAAGLPPPFAQVVEAADNINVHEKENNKEQRVFYS